MGAPKQTIYPFAEMFEVDTDGTDSVDIWDIPAGTIITRVLVKIKTAGSGSGNLTIGDDDTGDGYISAADATSSAGTVYGDAVTELGGYLDAGTNAGLWKVYTASGKELKLDCSNALSGEATLDVLVFGYRF